MRITQLLTGLAVRSGESIQSIYDEGYRRAGYGLILQLESIYLA